MAGMGCLAPFILAVIGAGVGHAAAGPAGLAWGLGVGFLAGGAMAAALWYVVARAKAEE